MAAWRNFGTLMVIFLAGLQTIPKEINEAAEVDGRAVGRFRYITLPMLRPVLLFGAVITGIGYLQFFEEAFVMTKGGPLDSTRSVTYYTFDQFGFGNFGYAAAASYLLFLAIVVLTFVQFRLLGDREDEEEMTVTTRAPTPPLRDPEDEVTDAPTTAGRQTTRPRGSSGARRRAVPRRRPVRLDARLVVQARGRGPGGAADVVARDPDPRQLRPAVHPAGLPDVLHELGDRGARGDRREHGLLLDARLRPGQAGLPRQEADVRDRARHPDGARRGHVRPAVRAHHQDGALQHACSG